MMPRSPRRARRLSRSAEFERVYRQGRSVSNRHLVLYSFPNESTDRPRLGLSVSRKVGQATHRNRLRRLYREAFRHSRAEMPTGLDLILIPRRPDEPALDVLQSSLVRLVRQLARKLEKEEPTK